MEHLHLCVLRPLITQEKKYTRPTKIITKIVPKQAILISNAKWASEPLSEDFHSPPCCPFLCLSVFPLSATPRITPTAPPPPLLHPVEPLLAGWLTTRLGLHKRCTHTENGNAPTTSDRWGEGVNDTLFFALCFQGKTPPRIFFSFELRTISRPNQTPSYAEAIAPFCTRFRT